MLIVNVADVLPAGIVTLAGTVAVLLSEDESATAVPEGPAGDDNTTVPAEFWPPTTVAGSI